MGRQPRQFPIGKYVIEIKGMKDNPSTKHSISLQYSWGGSIIRKTSGIRCTTKDWNSATGELRASYGREYQHNNEFLRQRKAKYDNLIKDYVSTSSSPLTKDVIKDILNDKPITRLDKGRDFVEFATERLESEYKRNKIGHSRYKNGLSSLSMFREFLASTGNGTYKQDSIYLSELTPELIDKLIDWRRRIKHNEDATINHALTPILKAAEAAYKLGLIKPEMNAALQGMRIEEAKKIDDGETTFDGKYLTTEQLTALVKAYDETKEVRRKEYLEIFLFAFHACGMRVVDIITLQWSHINFDKKEIKKIQVKTGKRNTIPLTDATVKILEKWKSKELKNRFVFGLLNDDFDLSDADALYRRRNSITQSINQSLIPVGEKLGLNFTLTMHVARHTFAVLALNSGSTMSVVSRLLGHTSTDVTERVYAQFLPETLMDELYRLNFNYIPSSMY